MPFSTSQFVQASPEERLKHSHCQILPRQRKIGSIRRCWCQFWLAWISLGETVSSSTSRMVMLFVEPLKGSQPFYLPQNAKQHYMIDLVDFLCCGKQCHDGHPQLHVVHGEGEIHRRVHFAHTCEVEELCMSPLSVEMNLNTVTTTFPSSDPEHRAFNRLWNRRLHLNAELQPQRTGLMGSLTSCLRPSNLTSSCHHGAQEDHDRAQVGCGPPDDCGPSRSTEQGSQLALLRSSCTSREMLSPTSSANGSTAGCADFA